MSESTLNPSGKSAITILVLGDGGVGKTSLISSLVSESWSERVPPVLQAVMVPPSLMAEHIQLTIIDTSSDPAHQAEWMMHLRPPGVGPNAAPTSASKASLLADAVLLVVSADVPDSFARVESTWLPLLESQAARFQMPRLPVIIAVNKSAQQDGSATAGDSAAMSSSMDLDSSYPALRLPHFDHLVASYRVSAVIPCSAKYLFRLSQIFYHCSTLILAPIEPLFDLAPGSGSGTAVMRFKLLTQRALLRIFRLFDADGDGVLSFAELDAMHQVNFKGKRLAAHAFDQLMRSLAATDRDFVRAVALPAPSAASAAAPSPSASGAAAPASVSVGLTFSGLLHFHYLFLQRNRHLWHTWSLVHHFGYALGQVPLQLHSSATNSASAASTAASSLSVPALGRGSSNPAASLSGIGGANAAPSLGSLVLSASSGYAKLPEGYNPSLSYELSPVAVEFLTNLFRKYDSDRDGLLCVRAGARATGDGAGAGAGASAADAVVCDAAPSSTCNLSASSDLERMFLCSPDQPFSASFARFVSLVPQAKLAGKSGSYIGLDGWLASWALLLHNYATTPLVVPATVTAAASAAGAAAHAGVGPFTSHASSSFSGLSSPPVPSASGTAPAAFAPNPDIVLRYLHYLCFPVTPASPEFSMVDAATAAAAGLHGTPVTSASSAGKQVKVYLPRIQRCIHVTPKRGADAEAAQNFNEKILLTDPSLSQSSARAQVSDAAAMQPRTVVCWVVGSTGCGKSSLIDCMIGNAPAGSSPLSQHVSSGTVAGLHGALGGSGETALESPSVRVSSSSSSAGSSSQPRTYAARLPLAHQAPPPSQGSAVPSQHADHAGIIDSSLKSASNRFLLLKEIPAKLAAPLLAAPSFTASSCDLLLLLYDGTSATSLTFLLQQLQICYEKRVPVLLIQTKHDYANCNLARNDLASTDFDAHVEEFSARLFWDSLVGPHSSPLPASCTIFERIYHAARHPSSYVLSSVSAARRAAQRTRWIVASMLLAGGLVGAATLAQLYGLLPSMNNHTAAAASATPPSVTIVTPASSDKALQQAPSHAQSQG